MNFANIGGNEWGTQEGVEVSSPDILGSFLEDTNKAKLANSIGDLLQLTRSRQVRQFIVKGDNNTAAKEDNHHLLSSSTPQLPTLKDAQLNKTSNDKNKVSHKKLSANPSRNPPPGVSYSIQERPPTKAEIDALEVELSERLRTVIDLSRADLHALDSGDLHQPHKDSLIIRKSRVQREFKLNDDEFDLEAMWMDKFVKSESLKEVCDAVAAQLTDMLAVSNASLGNVMRKLRLTYDRCFKEFRSSWVELRRNYTENTSSLFNTQQELGNVNKQLANHQEDTQRRVNEEIKTLTDAFNIERENSRAQLASTEFKMEQMTETLRSLNGIFRTMQADSNAINTADLAFKCSHLEKEVAHLSTECLTLDKVKDELALAKERLHLLERQLKEKEIELTSARTQLQKREELVTTLMEKESLRASEIEKLQKLVAEQQSEENAQDEFEEPPTSVLCIRCKKSLDDLGNLREAIYGSTGNFSERHCESFRVLLPNLRGKQPNRTISWVRYCIRGILVSKMKEDVNLLNIQGQISRFPEYVYAWFERYGVGKYATPTGSVPPLQQPFEIAVAMDEDRWGLYYGAKSLAKDDPEAKLFWSLLDETYGEDGLQFVLYCLSVILTMGGKDLWLQFGNILQQSNKYSSSISAFTAIGVNYSEPVNGIAQNNPRGTVIGGAIDPAVILTMSAGKMAAGMGGGAPGTMNLPSKTNSTNDLISPLGKQRIMVDVKIALEAVRLIMFKSGGSIQMAVDAINALSVIPETSTSILMRPKSASTAAALEKVNEGQPAARETNPASSSQASLLPTHICLFTWLRIMLQRYTDDQAHRTAAVNTMFETAALGALVPDHPGNDNEYCNSGGTGNNGNSVEFPQFQAVCRTLYPFLSMLECAALYVRTYYEGNRHVTAKAFTKVADEKGLFSRALRLAPLPLLREYAPAAYADVFDHNDSNRSLISRSGTDDAPSEGSSVTVKSTGRGSITDEVKARVQIASLVHRHIAASSKLIHGFLADLPEKWRTLLSEMFAQVHESLHGKNSWHKKVDSSQVVAKGGKANNKVISAEEKNELIKRDLYIDGLQPFVMYRRFCALALLIKSLTDNPLIPSTVLTGSKKNVLPDLSININKAVGLINAMETALHIENDDKMTNRLIRYDNAVKSILSRKLQKLFRAYMNHQVVIPRSVRFCMRSGYLRPRGSNLLRRRAFVPDPWWLQVQVAEIYMFKLNYDQKASKIGKEHISLSQAAATCMYAKYGCFDVAERVLHDLFYGVNVYQVHLPRFRMFAGFVGAGMIDEQIRNILCSYEAISLYLDLLVRLHREVDLANRIKVQLIRQVNVDDAFAKENAPPITVIEGVSERSEGVENENAVEEAPTSPIEISKQASVTALPSSPITKEASVVSTNGVSKPKGEPMKVALDMNEEVCGYSHDRGVFHIPTLFPGNERDPIVAAERKDAWLLPTSLLENVAIKWAASLMLPSAGSGDNLPDYSVYAQLVYKLKIDRNMCADVDDFLWIMIIYWAKVVSLTVGKASIKSTFLEKTYGGKKAHNTGFATGCISLQPDVLMSSFHGIHGPMGLLPDMNHTYALYNNYLCGKIGGKVPDLNNLLTDSALWDASSGGGGKCTILSAALFESSITGTDCSEVLAKAMHSSSITDVVNDRSLISSERGKSPHAVFMRQLGYDAEVMRHFNDDVLYSGRFNVNIHCSVSPRLSVVVAHKSYQAYQHAISELIYSLSKETSSPEVDRALFSLRKSVGHLEDIVSSVLALKEADDNFEKCIHLWGALSSVYASLDEITAMREMNFPQDTITQLPKLYLERSTVFSIQTVG